MNSSQPNRPRAVRVWFDDHLMHVELTDGRIIDARYDRFPSLRNASPQERANWEIIGNGVGIHWPQLDEDLSTNGLLRDAISVAAPQTAAAS